MKRRSRKNREIAAALEGHLGKGCCASGPMYLPKAPTGSTMGPGFYVKYTKDPSRWFFLGMNKAQALATAQSGKNKIA
jgi:hypothetical protein